MSERKTAKLIPYEFNYICDKCNKGIMEYTENHDYLATPMRFEHKCNNCGDVKTFNDPYPKITYEREEIQSLK